MFYWRSFLFGICSFGFVFGATLSGAEKVYDLVVYGGTSGAIIAAQQAVRMGHSVIVVSPDRRPGGLSSGGLGMTDTGDRSVIGSLSRDFYHRLWLYYLQDSSWKFQPRPTVMDGQGGPGMDPKGEAMWIFEPSAALLQFEQILKEYGIEMVRDEWLDREQGVEKEGTRILSITTLSGNRYQGKMFIDATYEGDLMAAAGVSYATGRESNSTYQETLNGKQTKMAVYHQFTGFVDPYIEPGNPASGILPGVEPETTVPDGTGDHRIQAYNLRACLTNCPENRVPFKKPQGYQESDYELLFRSIEAGQDLFTNFSAVPNHKTDSNNNYAVSTDFIGQNYDYPEASYERRREIYLSHRKWEEGLFWTLANHPRVPEKIRDHFSQWGVAKDEFTETDHWSPQLYVREARRMVGEFVMTQRHLEGEIPTPCSIGMGSYGMDSHHTRRIISSEPFGKPTVRNEGDVEVSLPRPYKIAYGSILPKKEECSNLLVPIAVSSSHIAYGSIRMEPVFMILSQSAATAGLLALEEGVAPQDLDYNKLRERLLADGQILENTDPR